MLVTAIITSLIVIPAVVGVIALLVSNVRIDLGLLVFAAAAHLAGTAALWILSDGGTGVLVSASTLVAVDTPALLFLSVTSLLFFVASLYAIPYVLGETHDAHTQHQLFTPCLLWFLAAMSLVMVSQHMAIMWAAVEATTLASAPLIYFYRKKAALEAAWKYLLICSIGIALALLGTFLLGMAASSAGSGGHELVISSLISAAPEMTRSYLKAAFVLALVGYGTKMGLVPLHTWLPDAHSQAPSPVSALLSGTLLNCAFLGILRFYQICLASGDAQFARDLLLLLGFLSIGVAGAFMIRQRDYKRLLAYSSVENMGVLAVGIGMGGAATYGALLHAVNHSLVKGGLFLLAGNVLRQYGTTNAEGVRGVLARLPWTGVLLTAAFLAVGGLPPFGPFMSEMTIFLATLQREPLLAALFVALLALAFLGMAGSMLPMLQGSDPAAAPRPKESVLAVATPLVLCAGALSLGLFVPSALSELLLRAAALFGG